MSTCSHFAPFALLFLINISLNIKYKQSPFPVLNTIIYILPFLCASFQYAYLYINMFPTSLEHPFQQGRGRRRGRNEPNNRDYICPCGKSYLSYPALFTHIKIKHNGRVIDTSYRLQVKLSSLALSTQIEEDVLKLYNCFNLERSIR